MITIQVNDRQVLDLLGELTRKCGNLKPAMKEIGEDLVASTKARFGSATGPDGIKWEANSQVTIDRFLGLHITNYRKDGSVIPNRNVKKDGSLSKQGAARAGAKKPLTGETGILGHTIDYQLDGNASVRIGSPQPYAAMQQFGGTKARWPHLWGDIPARPFLGVSDAEQVSILEVLGNYLV